MINSLLTELATSKILGKQLIPLLTESTFTDLVTDSGKEKLLKLPSSKALKVTDIDDAFTH